MPLLRMALLRSAMRTSRWSNARNRKRTKNHRSATMRAPQHCYTRAVIGE